MSADLEARVRRLEDRAQISEQVIRYALAVDRRDWQMFAGVFTDPVHADFSELGTPAADLSAAELAARVSAVLNGFTATQHLSPNHVIEFDEADPDRAVCYSAMFAQHYLAGADGGDFYLVRGSSDNSLRRTPGGWRSERLIPHVTWPPEGNRAALAQAAARPA